MKAIKVLGTGCANCRATVQGIEQVAKELNTQISLEKIEEIRDIMTYGILATPGVVVDGNVVHSGGVPSREKIEQWLTVADVERSSLVAGGCRASATRS